MTTNVTGGLTDRPMTHEHENTTSPAVAGIRELVALSSRILGHTDQGDLIWGHASARDPHGRGVWMKASGWGLEEITPDRVQLVSPSGEVLEGTGGRHSEYPIHTEIMAARADVGGVVHAHSPYAVALAAAGQPLLPVSHAATYFVPPEVPRFTDTADLILTCDLGKRVAANLGSASAVFLANLVRRTRGFLETRPHLPSPGARPGLELPRAPIGTLIPCPRLRVNEHNPDTRWRLS